MEVGGWVEFYCKNVFTAKSFEIQHGLLKSDITTEIGEKYLRRFLVAMFKMGLPPFLYVSSDTYNKYFA